MRAAFAALWIASAVFCQETPLNRLKREAAALKDKPSEEQVTAVHSALQGWIEAHLPPSARTPVEFRNIEETLRGELGTSGVSLKEAPKGDFGPGFGYVGFQLKWFPKLPDGLFFIASVSAGCGTDDAIYLYRFDVNGRARVVEERPPSKWGMTGPQIELSDLDYQGRRLMLTHFVSVQCGSAWMGMAYSVYRLGLPVSAHSRLVSAQHGFWLGNGSPTFVLRPDELMIQFRDRSVSVAIHNRTNLERFSFAGGIHRRDPVAFQPQDFVEEWLARPWSEMQSRSTANTKSWYDRLHSELIFADYRSVTRCASRPGRWVIILDIRQIGEKELPKALTAYFLVHELGNCSYQMESVSANRPSGCPGDGDPSDKHPYLTEAELKSLH